ncbi:MAG TPA: hypothetical protein VMB82_03580 [Acidimicrobiales bacterium]|nr:hypothetical protein [Acidimicrobiales bacterium]
MDSAGDVYGSPSFGSTSRLHLNKPILGIASTPSGNGYWLVAADGGVFGFGGAAYYGSVPGLGINLSKPIVGIASTPSGNGYWLVAADGGVFGFGGAAFYGSLAAINLHAPIVGITTTHSGMGYWLDSSDGGVFALGDAEFFGSTPASAGSIVGPLFPTPDQRGYWLSTSSQGSPAFAKGFGDVLACWGGSNTIIPGAPAVVSAAAVGGVDRAGSSCVA